MIALTAFSGQTVALFGAGASGRATAQALMEGGATVIAWDDNPASVAACAQEGIATGDLHEADWSRFDAFVLTPGVPLTHPKPHWTVKLAHAAGVPVIGDIELFCRERRHRGVKAPMVAITGTNGKSTTTALIAHLLRHAGRDVQMGGNIGVPVLQLEPPVDGRIYVVECSSYQIDLAPGLDADIGILLNVTPDHLDRHGSIENYAAIKTRLVAQAGDAVIMADDAWTRQAALSVRNAHVLTSDADGPGLDLSRAPALRGAHNLQNALAARQACRLLGLSDAQIDAGLAEFGGLAHRMQIIARRGDLVFVNDSKATNADAAAKSLSAFDAIYWIAGGLPKEGGIEPLAPLFARIRKAYLIGEAAPLFAATLGSAVPFEVSGTLDEAVAHATLDAESDSSPGGKTVLLAPAAASFDQFANFEKRGAAFEAAVARVIDNKDVG